MSDTVTTTAPPPATPHTDAAAADDEAEEEEEEEEEEKEDHRRRHSSNAMKSVISTHPAATSSSRRRSSDQLELLQITSGGSSQSSSFRAMVASCSSSSRTMAMSIPSLNDRKRPVLAMIDGRGAHEDKNVLLPAAAMASGGFGTGGADYKIKCIGTMSNSKEEEEEEKKEAAEAGGSSSSCRRGASSLVVAGGFLYAGSSSTNTITVWNISRGMTPASGYCAYRLGRLSTAQGAVKAMVVVGDKLISAHHDHRIRVWRRSSQRKQPHRYVVVGPNNPDNAAAEFYDFFKLLATMPTAENYLRAFVCSPRFIRLRRNEGRRLWIEHGDAISALAVGKGGRFLYSASWDRSIKVWRLSDFMCVESLQKAHDDAVNAMVVSGEGEGLLYTGSADGKIKVWAMCPAVGGRPSSRAEVRHTLVATLEGHRSAVNALALLEPRCGDRDHPPALPTLLLYSGASEILVWEREESVEHMSLAGALRGHRHPVLCLAAVRSSNHLHKTLLCSGSADRTVRVWSRVDDPGPDTQKHCLAHTCLAVLQGHSGPVKCLATSPFIPPPPSSSAATAQSRPSARNRALSHLAVSGATEAADPHWKSMANQTPTGFYLFSGSLDHEIKIWWILPSMSQSITQPRHV